jgi:hypothetical protein
MTTRNPMRTAGLLLAVALAAATSLRPAAQGARPPDIAGEWRVDSAEDPGQPPLADYLGLALNEAGRLRADTTPESIWGTAEYQCRPHSAPHQWRGVGGARIQANDRSGEVGVEGAHRVNDVNRERHCDSLRWPSELSRTPGPGATNYPTLPGRLGTQRLAPGGAVAVKRPGVGSASTSRPAHLPRP